MSWKHTAAPAPIVLRLEVDGGRVRHLVAEEYADEAMPDPWKVTADRLVDTARATPALSTNALIKRAGVSKGNGIAILDQLTRSGRMKPVDRAGKGGGREWHAAL